MIGEQVSFLAQRGDEQAAQLPDGEQPQERRTASPQAAVQPTKREQGFGLEDGLRSLGQGEIGVRQRGLALGKWRKIRTSEAMYS